jgi:phosphoglycerate dehydrogenase-like enzyme
MNMKTYIINPDKLHPETLEFYKSFTNLTNYIEDADIIIVSDFSPIETDKIVAMNATCPDNVKAPKIIKLEPETGELNDIVAVPELCLWAMLELVRKRGCQELKGKTLGIIGRGRIGTILGDMANNLGMKIATYDIVEDRGMNDLETVLNQDIVSLNISSTEENRGFMDKAKFETMKPNSYFLNSARPWLVDGEAFRWAMREKLAGAWVDFDLGWTAENLIQTNHIGGGTIESKKKTELIIAKKVKQYANSK